MKLVTRFAEQFQMDFGFMSAKEGHHLIKSHDGYSGIFLSLIYTLDTYGYSCPKISILL